MKVPSIDEITSYCLHRENAISPQAFFDYYESVGWKVGKTRKPMVSWQAAVRTWERNSPKPQQSIVERLTDRSWAN